MNLSDLDHDPRPDASQRVAAKRRARPAQAAPATPPIPWMPIGVVGCIVVLAIIFTRLPSVPTPRPLATSAPAARSAPTSTPVRVEPTQEPTAPPIATETPAQAVQEPPQIGRGLTIDDAASSAAPTYLDNVAAQAAHSPRGGYCGPTGGDCAPGVPVGVDSSQYLANVAKQAPHAVR